MFMRMRGVLVLSLTLSVCHAVFGSERLVELADKLCQPEYKMFDYAEYALKQAIDAHPDDIALKMALADVYMRWNKPDKSQKIMDSLPKSGEGFARGQYGLGITAVKKGNFEFGVKCLKNYLDHFSKVYKTAPPRDGSKDDENYRMAVGYLKFCYEQIDPKKVPSAVAYMDFLGSVDPREQKYFALDAKLTAAEKLIQNGESGWEGSVNSTLKEFDELRWVQDALAASSYVGKARALCLLGRYKDAMAELDMGRDLLKSCDDAYEDDGIIGQSPGGLAAYWKGRVYQGMAAAGKDDKEKIKLYSKALVEFVRVLTKYGGCPEADDAFAGVMECRKTLEDDFGKSIKLPKAVANYRPAGNTSLVVGEAARLLKENMYEDAVPLLLPLFLKNRDNPAAQEVLINLGLSYAHSGRELESMAVADYLSCRYPESEVLAVALLQMGQILWDGAEKRKTAAGKLDGRDDSIRVYESFIRMAPQNQYAGDICARIANEYYSRARDLAKDANKSPGGEKRQALKAKAVAAYKAVIPLYRRIVDNYGHTKWGIASLYTMAVCYGAAKQFDEAAKTYLDFCSKEKKDKNKIAKAKFQAAVSYFDAGGAKDKEAARLEEQAMQMALADEDGEDTAPPAAGATTTVSGPKPSNPMKAEAVKLFAAAKDYFGKSAAQLDELIDVWFVKDGRLGTPSGADQKSVVQSGLELLAWSYDAAGDKGKAVEVFKRFIAKYPNDDKAVPKCMMRLGVIYTEMGDDKRAEDILRRLVEKYPGSEEGKNAPFLLGRSLFNNRKWEKAVATFKSIVESPEKLANLQIASLRWIAGNLPKSAAEGEVRKQAGQVTAKICGILLEKIKKPVLEDWFGKKGAVEMAKNQKALKSQLKIIKQKLLYDAGVAESQAENYAMSLKYLDELLSDENTPYYYSALFIRGDDYLKLRRYADARNDFCEIASTAMGQKMNGFYSKAQALIGNVWMEEKNYNKAYATFSLLASGLDKEAGADLDMVSVDDGADDGGELTGRRAEQGKMADEWSEYAAYRAAYCAAKLGKDEERDEMVALYLKMFPQGIYKGDIRKLPKAEGANRK